MYIVTTPQMQAAERAADAAGLSYRQMMENAGGCVAEAIQSVGAAVAGPVLVLVGPGNNGGDGLVAARRLAQCGATVTVYVWQRQVTADYNWTLLDDTGVARVFWENDPDQAHLRRLINEAAVIVDALLGTGVSRPIAGTLAQLLAHARAAVQSRRAQANGRLTQPARPTAGSPSVPLVVAVDVPSGLNSDTGAVDPYTLPADLTVTLAAVKRGHVLLPGPDVVGRLVVGDIGLTPAHFPADVSLQMATPAKVAAMLPPRPASAHKGTFGTAVLAAGSINYPGAAILAGRSATRSGAGLVTMAVPQTIYPLVAAGLAEATYLPLPDSGGYFSPAAAVELRSKLGRADAVLVGPGVANTPATAGFLLELLRPGVELPPLVLDADALNILAAQPEWWALLPPHSILTPHPGEMARLTANSTAVVQANRLELAAQMAGQWQQTVLLKGAYTVVAAPDGRVMVLPFANPALAKAGSGDVLAGVITGVRAQGLPAFEAAVAGGYLHGLAGELARERLGVAGVTAGNLAGMLPAAWLMVAG